MNVSLRPLRPGLFLLALLLASSASADFIGVCAGGCDYTDLQAAIDAAQPGDTIVLGYNETFTGNFVLPDKGASTSYITLTTNAGIAVLPPGGRRIDPSYAQYLPKIRSGNTGAAITAAPGAHHYRLLNLELQANDHGYNEILALGRGDSAQTLLSQVPHDLILDRLYIHGDPWAGQKRCIGLNSASTTIVNSYVSDCKAVGQDAQAVGGFNGPGPFTIENNYLEGSTENVIFGGADPKIPGLIPSDITFRYNYLSKPLSWRQPIVATPQPTAAASTSGGTLPAGTYFYRVEARASGGYQGGTYRSAGSTEVSATVASGSTGAVSLSWSPIPGATAYRVFGRAAGAPTLYWTVTGTSFTDTGSGGTAPTSGDLPGGGTKWAVKNTFELKNARRVKVFGNIIENSWLQGQTGYVVVLTTANQEGACTWCVVDDVEVSYNLIRHGAGGVNILAADADGEPSGRTSSLSIHDNLFYDIDASWGSSERLFMIGQGPGAVTIDHNTGDHPNKAQFDAYGPGKTGNLILTNNLLQRGTYGIIGFSAAEGTAALNASATVWTFGKNTVAGAPASSYPADNFFPTVAAWQGQFVDYANNDFHLASTSPYKNAGTDGKDLGADMAGLDAAIDGVLTGQRLGAWQTADVGDVGLLGSSSLHDGTFTLEAGGTDIWSTADAFSFVYQPLIGDGEIVARIADLAHPAGAAWTLAAVTFRQSLSADSVHASMMITDTGKAKFRRRTTTGGTTASDGPTDGTTYPPRWVRLTRSGNSFSAYLSSDGVAWTQVHTPQTVAMSGTVYVGLLALRNGDGTPAGTAVFDNVTLRRLPSPWLDTDIGTVVPSGDASFASGQFTVHAGGTDLWDSADAFHYVYQPMSGDGEIVAQVTELSLPPGAAFSLGAVMMRQDLTPSSVHAAMMITTEGKAKFRRRTTSGGTTASDGPSAGTTTLPRYLKLTRSGNTFTAAISTDGLAWTQVHTPQTITMPADIWVGIAALRNGGTFMTEARFRNVTVVP